MKVSNCCVVRVPGIPFPRQFSPKTCDWKQNIAMFVRGCVISAWLAPGVSSSSKYSRCANLRQAWAWQHSAVSQPWPGKASHWLMWPDPGLWLVSLSQPRLGPVRAHGTNPDDWLSRVSLQMHLQSAAVKTGTGAAVEQVADCSDSGEPSWAACRVCRPIWDLCSVYLSDRPTTRTQS